MRRIGVLLSLFAGVPLGTPATAVAADVLAADTAVRGEGGTYAELRLDRPLRALAGDRFMKVELAGDGDVLAIELRKSDAPRDPGVALVPSLHAHRIGGRDSTTVQLRFARLSDGMLPAGVYRLYAMSDRPVSARLRFLDAAGRSDVVTSAPFPFRARALAPRELVDGTVSFGAEDEILNQPSLMFLDVVRASSPFGQRLEVCYYPDGAASGAGDAAFGPGCPGGQSMLARTDQGGERPETFTVLDPPPGRIGLGGNLTSPGGGTAAPFVAAAWASFIEDLAAPATAAPPPQMAPAPAIELLSHRATARRGRARVHVRCSAAARCHGAVRLAGGPARRLRLAPGARARIALAIPDRLRRALRRRRGANAVVAVVLDAPGGRVASRQGIRVRR